MFLPFCHKNVQKQKLGKNIFSKKYFAVKYMVKDVAKNQDAVFYIYKNDLKNRVYG